MADPIPTRALHNKHVEEAGGYAATSLVLQDERGYKVQIEICTTCHLIERAVCEHTNCSWYDKAGIKIPKENLHEHPDGVLLICDLCGIDGT